MHLTARAVPACPSPCFAAKVCHQGLPRQSRRLPCSGGAQLLQLLAQLAAQALDLAQGQTLQGSAVAQAVPHSGAGDMKPQPVLLHCMYLHPPALQESNMRFAQCSRLCQVATMPSRSAACKVPTDQPQPWPASLLNPARLTCMSSSTALGSTMVCWLGLFLALPILASSLFCAMPADTVKSS